MKSPSLKDPSLQKIKNFYNKKGRMPSYAEIAALLGYASKQAAFRRVAKWMEAGWVAKDRQGRLIPQAQTWGLPLAGYVQAGFPSPAEEELLDTMTLDQYLVRRPDASFLLKVTGDSMIEAGIQPGDLVVIEKGGRPKNGDIVLAEIDRDWTLKYYHKECQVVSLVPGNPKYPVLYPREELVIAGVVAAVVRRYR